MAAGPRGVVSKCGGVPVRVPAKRGGTRARRVAGLAAACGLILGSVPAVAGPAHTQASGSPFRWRGIVEGFYGTPYPAAERADLLRFEAAHGMNVYVHAPKQDPYVRTLWRHPYPAAQMRELRGEVAWARHHGIAWVPDVGPGVPLIPSPNVALPDRDICFSCPADLRLLVDRYRPFVAAGSPAVMVSFDDTEKVSTHPEDVAAYGRGDAAYGTMTADAVNAVAHAYPHTAVLTVPADYSGTRSTAYLRAFAKRLDPRVVVLWTGTAVVAPTIRRQDALAFDRVVHRRVLVWDNYPANDWAGGIVGEPTNLFMGPLVGRGPDLVGAISGILSNPMDEWSPSELPLATVADFLDDPWHYQPEQSWQRALHEIGGRHTKVVAKFADNVRSSVLGQADAIRFSPLVAAFLAAYRGASWPAAAQQLRRELVAERDAPGRLAAVGFDPAFRREAAPFLARLTANAAAALTAVDLLAAQRPALTVTTHRRGDRVTITGQAAAPSPSAVVRRLAALTDRWASTMTDHHNVHGDRFAFSTSGDLYARRNAVDQFVHAAQALTAQWTPNAAGAASSVTVTVDGRRVPASFARTVRPDRVVSIVATDGAGDRTQVDVHT